MNGLRTRLLGVVALVGIVALIAVAVGRERRARAMVTFTKDVAPIVYANCAPCHRPGQAGPFSLLTYEDVTKHATQIERVTRTRYMPPWRPVHGSVAYANERGLTPAQIDVLGRWVREGTKRGDPRDLPKMPSWPEGWQLGTPDLVLTLPEPYALAAEGRDVYRNFVIPSGVTGTHYVTAWEFRPGTRTVHHAIMNVDRLGLARRRDEAEPGPGFSGMDVGNAQSADGYYLVWAPGKVPTPPDPRMGWKIDRATDLVLQLHLQPSGKPELVNPEVALYFSDRPPTIPRLTIRVGDAPIDIPAGDAHYTTHASYRLAADVSLISLFPHAHYVAKTVHAKATLPDGTTQLLLDIEDWDFKWQDEYTFAKPLRLPAGTELTLDITYDNSAANPRNPNQPPARVVGGERSVDEMGNVTFQVIPKDAAAMLRLREARYVEELAHADTAKGHYNLANVLADEGRTDDAITHYRRAMEEEPTLVPAAFNLANLLARTGDRAGAIGIFEGLLKTNPASVDVLVNLGHVVEGEKPTEAIAYYERAVTADPKSPIANFSLAAALAMRGEQARAVEHFRQGLATDPNNAAAQAGLAQALAAMGQSEAR